MACSTSAVTLAVVDPSHSSVDICFCANREPDTKLGKNDCLVTGPIEIACIVTSGLLKGRSTFVSRSPPSIVSPSEMVMVTKGTSKFRKPLLLS